MHDLASLKNNFAKLDKWNLIEHNDVLAHLHHLIKCCAVIEDALQKHVKTLNKQRPFFEKARFNDLDLLINLFVAKTLAPSTLKRFPR